MQALRDQQYGGARGSVQRQVMKEIAEVREELGGEIGTKEQQDRLRRAEEFAQELGPFRSTSMGILVPQQTAQRLETQRKWRRM